ncbi:hypothetical protein D9Q98_010673, partial [Chlorella vulgaris]
SLFSLYLVLKFLPDLNLQTLLNAYFWLLGSISLVGAFGPTLRTLGKGLKQPVWQFEVPEWAQAEDEQGKVVTKSDIVPTDVLSVAAALTIATLDATANHGNFTLNNMIAHPAAGGPQVIPCGGGAAVWTAGLWRVLGVWVTVGGGRKRDAAACWGWETLPSPACWPAWRCARMPHPRHRLVEELPVGGAAGADRGLPGRQCCAWPDEGCPACTIHHRDGCSNGHGAVQPSTPEAIGAGRDATPPHLQGNVHHDISRKLQRNNVHGASMAVSGSALGSKDSLYTIQDAPAAPTTRIPAAQSAYDRYGDQTYSRAAVPNWQ